MDYDKQCGHIKNVTRQEANVYSCIISIIIITKEMAYDGLFALLECGSQNHWIHAFYLCQISLCWMMDLSFPWFLPFERHNIKPMWNAPVQMYNFICFKYNKAMFEGLTLHFRKALPLGPHHIYNACILMISNIISCMRIYTLHS